MKPYKSMLLIKAMLLSLVLGSSIYSPSILAGDAGAKKKSGSFFAYKPPRRGAPATRIGGGTRGIAGQDNPEVHLLVPEHTGLSANEQPVLHWFVSGKPSADVIFEFALVNDDTFETLVETRLQNVNKAGYQVLKLADFGVRLEPGMPYQWSVALVIDEKQRSGDIISSGTIEYVAPGSELAKQLAASSPMEQARTYAESGYWYDSINILSVQDDARSRANRDALLEQAGLGNVVKLSGE